MKGRGGVDNHVERREERDERPRGAAKEGGGGVG